MVHENISSATQWALAVVTTSWLGGRMLETVWTAMGKHALIGILGRRRLITYPTWSSYIHTSNTLYKDDKDEGVGLPIFFCLHGFAVWHLPPPSIFLSLSHIYYNILGIQLPGSQPASQQNNSRDKQFILLVDQPPPPPPCGRCWFSG